MLTQAFAAFAEPQSRGKNVPPPIDLADTFRSLADAMKQIDEAAPRLGAPDRETVKTFLARRAENRGGVDPKTLQGVLGRVQNGSLDVSRFRATNLKAAPKRIEPRTANEIDRRLQQIDQAVVPMWDNFHRLSPDQRARAKRLLSEATRLNARKEALATPSPPKPAAPRHSSPFWNAVEKGVDDVVQFGRDAGQVIGDDFETNRAYIHKVANLYAGLARRKFPTGLVPKDLYRLLENGQFTGDRYRDRLVFEVLRNIDPTQIPEGIAAMTGPNWREVARDSLTLGLTNRKVREKLGQMDPDA